MVHRTLGLQATVLGCGDCQGSLRTAAVALDIRDARLLASTVRTTVTVDDELYERLRERARQSRRSLTSVLNEAIALGLVAGSASIPRKVELSVFSLGLKEGLSYDNIGDLLDQLDDPVR